MSADCVVSSSQGQEIPGAVWSKGWLDMTMAVWNVEGWATDVAG